MEDLLSHLKIRLEKLKKSNLLALKLVLDDGPVKETLEGVEHLELTDDGIAVVKRLGKDRGETAFKLLDALAELKEVVVELTLLDVKNVVLNEHEIVDSLSKLVEDGKNVGGHGLSLGVTNFDLLELAKLGDGTGQVHDILAALSKGVKTNKESVGGDLPLVFGLALVVEIGVLELRADVKSEGKLLVSVC